jgi:hypothetical protein
MDNARRGFLAGRCIVSIAAAEGHVYALKDFGNKPSGRYILRNADWIDMLPQEFVKQGGYHHGK